MMKRILFILILLLLIVSPTAHAHVDPPFMTLTMDPDMPDVNEPAELKIQLIGSITGIPTYGAIITVVITNESMQQEFRIRESEQPGLYIGEIRFPELEMWDMRVDIEHDNELDIRRYMVHVMKPMEGYHNVLRDETLLIMDKNAAGQPIPPRVVLEVYALIVVLLLVSATVIKRRRLNVKGA